MTSTSGSAPSEQDIGEAQVAAERLASKVESQGMDIAWHQLEIEIDHYERQTDGTIEEILPPGADVLAFRLPTVSKARQLARSLLCNQRDDLRPVVEATVEAGAGALVPVLFSALALPGAAIGIAVVFAAVISVRGLEGFCMEEAA